MAEKAVAGRVDGNGTLRENEYSQTLDEPWLGKHRVIGAEHHTDEIDNLTHNKKGSQYLKTDSEETIVGKSTVPTQLESTEDKIEFDGVARAQDGYGGPVIDTLKHTTQSAKKKLYLNHRKRIQYDLDQQAAATHTRQSHMRPDHDPESQLSRIENQGLTVWQNIGLMFTTFPYWNMAFWSGFCYSIGGVLFIIAGVWTWAPLQWPETEFPGQVKYGVPLGFFFGACLFLIGGIMGYLEAVNDGCFAGAAMKKLLVGHQDIEKELLDAKLHTFFGHIVPHHHRDDEKGQHRCHESSDSGSVWTSSTMTKNKDTPKDLYDLTKERVEQRGDVHPEEELVPKQGQVTQYLTWRWYPTWHSFRTYHIFEIGYIACAIQLFGVTLYSITSVVILPGVLDSLEWWQALGAYWAPQVVAGCCFLTASILFTVMVGEKWYIPKPGSAGWWVGVHAGIGSVGFLLCAIFGLYSNDHTWAEYQSALSYMWGSVFYTLSGLFQWYETINVNVGPVLSFPNHRTPVLLRLPGSKK